MREQKDFGLLILRGAGLRGTASKRSAGIGRPFTRNLYNLGLAPLIARMGFPIPFALALWITFNESIGAFLMMRLSDATWLRRASNEMN